MAYQSRQSRQSRLGVGMSLRALDTDNARWNFALCTLKGQTKRRLRSRFPTAHPMDAQCSFVIRGIALKVPREFLTPEIWQGLIEGWYECEEDEIAAVLRPNDVVLELGTGLGFISTFVARQPGIRRIVSIEANPKLVDIARQNHALNGARVEMINAVAASKDGTSHFYLHDDFWTSSMTPQPGTTVIELPARSISGLLADIKPSVLIVDIEGGEASIFDGVDLSTVRDAILEVHPDVIGLEGVSRVFAHMAATGLLYNPRLSSRAIVVFSRCG